MREKSLIEKNHRVNYDDSKSLIENVERLKTEILPLYPEVVIEAIDKITDLESLCYKIITKRLL